MHPSFTVPSAFSSWARAASTACFDSRTVLSPAGFRICQLGLWALARWALVSAARRRSSYLCPIKAEKVPDASNNLICKSKVPVRGADVAHISNDGSHGTVIESTATMCLPVFVDIGARRAFENWKAHKWLPSICTGHDSPVVVQAAHWEAISVE